MKSLFKIALILIVALSGGAKGTNDTEKVRWLTTFEEATQIASKQDKAILLVFAGSDWCRPCIKLNREVFETEPFKAFAVQKLILLEIDFPRNKKNRLSAEQIHHNEKLAEKYNPNGEFPLVLLLNTKAEVVARIGYEPGGPNKFVKKLSHFLLKNAEPE